MNQIEKIEKKALEVVMSNLVEYLNVPNYTIETYSTGQDKRRERRKKERKNKKK